MEKIATLFCGQCGAELSLDERFVGLCWACIMKTNPFNGPYINWDAGSQRDGKSLSESGKKQDKNQEEG